MAKTQPTPSSDDDFLTIHVNRRAMAKLIQVTTAAVAFAGGVVGILAYWWPR